MSVDARKQKCAYLLGPVDRSTYHAQRGSSARVVWSPQLRLSTAGTHTRAAPTLALPPARQVPGIAPCVDMRQVNRAVITDGYPLPRIEGVLHGPNGSRFFSRYDLKDAYHQLQLHPNPMSSSDGADLNRFWVVRNVYGFRQKREINDFPMKITDDLE